MNDRVCEICGYEFTPKRHASNQLYCLDCAPPKSSVVEYNRFIRGLHPVTPDKKREYNRRWRAKIQAMWGYGGGRRGSAWVDAEHLAISILGGEGFTSVVVMNSDDPLAPFDLFADKPNGTPCAVQVTIATHNVRHKSKVVLAAGEDRGFVVLYVKPDLSRYIIKEGRGAGELSLNDMSSLSEI